MTLHLDELVVSHGEEVLVDVGELRLDPGEAVSIVGESGSGKSLLAHAIMGTLAGNLEARGRLRVAGRSYDLADPGNRRTAWGRTMALLPQEPTLALDPTMRVRDQVAEGVRDFGTDRRRARAAAGDQLGTVGLRSRGRAFPHTLSGGMAQRVAFAAATIGRAELLIADEPSKGLDRGAREDLAGLLARHVADGGMLLTITHDLDLARELGGTVLVMRNAEIVERGPAQQVLTAPGHDYTRRLLAAEPVNWSHRWVRAQSSAQSPAAGEDPPVLVEAERISKAYGDQELFADLSLRVRSGDRIALAGPSGSGKTTLGNVLLRLQSPDSGVVRHGAALGAGRAQKLYQDPAQAFPRRVTLRESLGDVVRRHRRDPSLLAELSAALGLPPALLTRRPSQVSGGELQRLAIIRSMLLEPMLLLADEPTSRLDLITQQETMTCLMEQVERHDCALVLVTHDETLAAAVTDQQFTLATVGHRTRASRLAG